ncbi:hypothetical protein BHE74_00026091 [Ensete ventricosum]|nr:hypothetical protein BHE74_00026091 [Ensete ventricosum]
MDLNVLCRKPRISSRKNPSTAGAKSSPPKVEEIRVETTTKRPVKSSAPDQATADRPGNLGVRAGGFAPTLAKDLYTLPSEILMAQAAKQIALGHHYQMALLDRVHDTGHLADNAKLKSELEELTHQSDQADKELNELRESLAESQHHIKEQKVVRRKADDELLKLMRDNETLKADLPSKSVADYKQ